MPRMAVRVNRVFHGRRVECPDRSPGIVIETHTSEKPLKIGPAPVFKGFEMVAESGFEPLTFSL